MAQNFPTEIEIESNYFRGRFIEFY